MIKQIKKKLVLALTISSIVWNGFPPIYAEAIEVFGLEQSDVVENKSVSIEPQIIEEILQAQALLNEKEPEEEYLNGWTTTKVNVREHPHTNAGILATFDFNTFVEYVDTEGEWVKIKYGDYPAYISKEYISNEKCLYQEYRLPEHEDFKSYMGYNKITDKTSNQYKIQHQYAYTGDYGIRMVNNRYCVAIGSHFNTEIGQYFDLVLKNGTIISCIMGDLKDNRDTDNLNIFTRNGCCSEFIIDNKSLSTKASISGSISSVNNNWNSPVTKILVYEKNILSDNN